MLEGAVLPSNWIFRTLVLLMTIWTLGTHSMRCSSGTPPDVTLVKAVENSVL